MHGGGGGGSGSKKKARIEIIPLIDVIMFLLATFVLFTLSMNKSAGAKVNLEEADTGIDIERVGTATVSLNTDGEIFWDKEKETWDGFIIRLVQHAEVDDPRIIINFDSSANYGQAMSVLNEIRKAPKPVKVYISTKPKQTNKS